MYYSPVRHSPSGKQASLCCRSTCMCKAFRQRSIWARIKLYSLILCCRSLFRFRRVDFSTLPYFAKWDFFFTSTLLLSLSRPSSSKSKSRAHSYRFVFLVFKDHFHTNHPLSSFRSAVSSAQNSNITHLFLNCQVYEQKNKQKHNQPKIVSLNEI